MRNQPIVATEDKVENHDFHTMINRVLGFLRDATEDPGEGKGKATLTGV